jgi:hypothetical protein
MMFLIGQGERVVPVGPPEPQHCPHCEEVTDFQARLKYKFGQFDLLFGFVYGKRYQLACPQCNHGWLLDTKAVEQSLDRIPIPFHLRFGFFILFGLVAALGTAAYVARHPAW